MQKLQFIKTISLALVVVTTLPNLAWAKKAPTVLSPAQMQFEPKAKYVIDLKNSGQSIKVGGSHARISGKTLIIADSKTGETKNIDMDSVNTIRQQKGSHALLGMGIGAAVGGAAGTAMALSGNCQTSGDPGDCEAFKKLGVVIGLPIGLVGGGLLGLAVGAAIKKEKDFVFTPIISPMANNQTYGLGMTKRF